MLWFFSRHYFVNDIFKCGEITEELTRKGYGVLLNYCTEDAKDTMDVRDATFMYRSLVSIAAARNVSGGRVMLSVKMSQFGCFWENPEAGQALEEMIHYAALRRVPVMLDGEPLVYAERQVRFGMLMRERYRNVGVRLQAHNKANPDFFSLLQGIIRENIGTEDKMPIGICKGAYHESQACRMQETRRNFVAGVWRCLEQSQPVSIDTHDESLVEEIGDLIAAEGPVPTPPSFGLLYNVKPRFARRLKNEKKGSTVFIYLPVIDANTDHCDMQWEKFAIRRLLERPTYIFLPFKLFFDTLRGRYSY